jgi:hypothetical protein
MFETRSVSVCIECGYLHMDTDPPKFCPKCCVSSTGSDLKLAKKGGPRIAGNVHKGLKLVTQVGRKWVCFCLWCKNSTVLVNTTNLDVQQSCGCQRSNPLKALEYYDNGLVKCVCNTCGLTKNYDLHRPGAVVCSSNCAVYTSSGKYEAQV